MSDPYVIYGRIEFPPRKLSAWRAAEITDHLDYARGNAFEPTTVGDVIDEAASFGFVHGQFIEVEESANSIELKAYLVDGEFWQAVKPIVTAFHAAAPFGATGDLRVAEAPGPPDVLTIGKGKASIKRPRTPPPGDDEAQAAILDHVAALASKKKSKKR